MRNKKTKSNEIANDRVERPMSWEGELSDMEMKQVRAVIFTKYFDTKLIRLA